ncbi:hypothetical protein FAIPA1_380014 [Frankia sp. AiPs1]
MVYDVYWAQHILPPSSLNWTTQLTFHYITEFNEPTLRFQQISYDNGLSCRENIGGGVGTIEISESNPVGSETWNPDCDDPGYPNVGWTNTAAVSYESYIPGYIDVFAGVNMDITDDQAIRCDHLRGNYNAGCVVVGTTPIIPMSMSDGVYGVAARNYATAQDTLQGNPGRHGRGKTDGNLLYYTSDQSLQDKNRTNKCRNFVTSPGNQCDEYPPATTTREDDYDALGNWQGVRGVTYEVYDISATANNGAGNALRVGYGGNRIVDGDGFYIELTP